MISRLDRLQMQTYGIAPDVGVFNCDVQTVSLAINSYCLKTPCNKCMFRSGTMEELVSEMEKDLYDLRTASVNKRAA